MAEGFAGDPGHEGGSQPMKSLQGGMAMPYTQSPMTSENQVNPRSAAPDNIGSTWNTTVIGSGSGGGSHGNPANAIHH